MLPLEPGKTSAGPVKLQLTVLMLTVLLQVLEVQPPLVVVRERVKLPLLPGITATCWPVPPRSVPLPEIVHDHVVTPGGPV